MRVAVSGGTGFLGSHAVAALLADGHSVRVLARDPTKLARAVGPLGVDPGAVEVVAGDLVDAASVRSWLGGCDAALHTAALARLGAEPVQLERTNVGGTRAVLGTALELGLDPVVHVSSVSAVFPPPGDVLHAGLPVTESASAYGRSKAAADRYARSLQDDGSPVTILYPGGIAGPDDPGLSAVAEGWLRFLRPGVLPIVRTGGNLFVDVRDLATVCSRLMERGQGARRFMAGGVFLDWAETADVLDAVTGRRIRRVPVPGSLLRGVGRAMDGWGRLRGRDAGWFETFFFMSRLCPSDDAAVHDRLGVEWRPVAETFGDFYRWLVAAGHLAPDAGGRPPRSR